MGTYEGQLKSIETKLALLQFTDEETANIIEKAQVSSLERQRKIVEKKVDEHSVSEMEMIAKEIKRKQLEEEKQAELSFTAQMKEKQFEKELQFEEEKYEKRLHL
ncbi:hypothetical protein OS493_012859 [Desmophyllum pertusum]|uniref:Uncharacterized protein n=1 Tax=Desmophyllum pertusum TaxID=174260 RepID=A0A9W9Z1J9_9CNID|nr:hypothetical protein OS493_012859 [Desmophyllum pertusum]